jgi:hypothetical protein
VARLNDNPGSPAERGPQILPPTRRAAGNQNISDEQLERLASLLDDVFRLPGTNIRFGLDAIIGLVPGVGDVLTGIMSFVILFAAWQRGLPRATLARMLFNVTVDTLIGTVPVLGDSFDVLWKSNRMNYSLLLKASSTPPRKQALHDWLFLLLMIATVAALMALPVVLLLWLVRLAR